MEQKKVKNPEDVVYDYDFKEFIKQFNLPIPNPNTSCNLRHDDVRLLLAAKNYLEIKSKVYQINFRNGEAAGKYHKLKDKVVIKRRILNDYINIVNEGTNIVNKIQQNLDNMVKVHDNTIHYFRKYYNKSEVQRSDNLYKILSPEYRHGLNSLDHNAKRIQRRLDQYEQSQQKQRQSRSFYGSYGTTGNNYIDPYSPYSQGPPQQQASGGLAVNNNNDQQAPAKRQSKFEWLGKLKGYFSNQNDIEDAKQDIKQLIDLQKMGSDKLKLKLFEDDMKEIIKKQKQNPKSNNNQQSPPHLYKEKSETTRKAMQSEKSSGNDTITLMESIPANQLSPNLVKLLSQSNAMNSVKKMIIQKQKIQQQSQITLPPATAATQQNNVLLDYQYRRAADSTCLETPNTDIIGSKSQLTLGALSGNKVKAGGSGDIVGENSNSAYRNSTELEKLKEISQYLKVNNIDQNLLSAEDINQLSYLYKQEQQKYHPANKFRKSMDLQAFNDNFSQLHKQRNYSVQVLSPPVYSEPAILHKESLDLDKELCSQTQFPNIFQTPHHQHKSFDQLDSKIQMQTQKNEDDQQSIGTSSLADKYQNTKYMISINSPKDSPTIPIKLQIPKQPYLVDSQEFAINNAPPISQQSSRSNYHQPQLQQENEQKPQQQKVQQDDSSDEETREKIFEKMLKKKEDIFKYKKLNEQFIEKYYKQRLLGLQKDAKPMLDAETLKNYSDRNMSWYESPKSKKKRSSELLFQVLSQPHPPQSQNDLDFDNRQIIRKHGQNIFASYQVLQSEIKDLQKQNKRTNKLISKSLSQSHKGFKTIQNQFRVTLGKKNIIYWKQNQRNFEKLNAAAIKRRQQQLAEKNDKGKNGDDKQSPRHQQQINFVNGSFSSQEKDFDKFKGNQNGKSINNNNSHTLNSNSSNISKPHFPLVQQQQQQQQQQQLQGQTDGKKKRVFKTMEKSSSVSIIEKKENEQNKEKKNGQPFQRNQAKLKPLNKNNIGLDKLQKGMMDQPNNLLNNKINTRLKNNQLTLQAVKNLDSKQVTDALN